MTSLSEVHFRRREDSSVRIGPVLSVPVGPDVFAPGVCAVVAEAEVLIGTLDFSRSHCCCDSLLSDFHGTWELLAQSLS